MSLIKLSIRCLGSLSKMLKMMVLVEGLTLKKLNANWTGIRVFFMLKLFFM